VTRALEQRGLKTDRRMTRTAVSVRVLAAEAAAAADAATDSLIKSAWRRRCSFSVGDGDGDAMNYPQIICGRN